MRYLPLLPSTLDATPWPSDVELRWEGQLHPTWRRPARGVHAVHLPAREYGDRMLQEAAGVFQAGLQPDFLILPVTALADRAQGFSLLGTLEMLLEIARGRFKLALRLEPELQGPVLQLLREARAEAVGFCYAGGDPEPMADRLWCAVAGEGTGVDLARLQALGYRWNVALAARTPESFAAEAAHLEAAHPSVLFPERLPDTMLGRTVVPDPSVTLGAHWEGK